MKKLLIFCNCVFISLCLCAQVTTFKGTTKKNKETDDFCSVLSKIMAEAPDQFEKLKAEKFWSINDPNTGYWVGKGWVSTISFPGALNSFVAVDSLYHSYISYFGNYKTLVEATKKLEGIKKQLMNCLPGLIIKEQVQKINDFEGFPVTSSFMEKKADSTQPQVIDLYIRKDTSIYSVYLQVDELDAGNICDMLKKIELCAAGNFIYNSDYLKEDFIYDADGNRIWSGYKTDLLIPGTQYSYISTEQIGNPSVDNRYYKLGVKNFNSKNPAHEEFEKIKNILAACLVNYKLFHDPEFLDGYYPDPFRSYWDSYQFIKQTGQYSSLFLLKLETEGLKDSAIWTISLTVPAKGRVTSTSEPKNAIKSDLTTQTTFAKQLLELLDYSKDGFKTIKGNINEALTEKNKFLHTTFYMTDYTLEGAIENNIEEYGSLKEFKAYYGKDITQSVGYDLFKKLSEQLKQDFTDGFVIQEKTRFSDDVEDESHTVRVQRIDDKTHYIELTLFSTEGMAGSYISLYITVE